MEFSKQALCMVMAVIFGGVEIVLSTTITSTTANTTTSMTTNTISTTGTTATVITTTTTSTTAIDNNQTTINNMTTTPETNGTGTVASTTTSALTTPLQTGVMCYDVSCEDEGCLTNATTFPAPGTTNCTVSEEGFCYVEKYWNRTTVLVSAGCRTDCDDMKQITEDAKEYIKCCHSDLCNGSEDLLKELFSNGGRFHTTFSVIVVRLVVLTVFE